jgi:hypothetical protein
VAEIRDQAIDDAPRWRVNGLVIAVRLSSA